MLDAAEPFRQLFEVITAAQDRRSNERKPYTGIQRIVYLTGVPSKPVQVYFRDVSASGCSFITRELPKCDDLLVELGKCPNCVYMQAKVAHIAPTRVAGQLKFTVGCRFIRRADPSGPADAT